MSAASVEKQGANRISNKVSLEIVSMVAARAALAVPGVNSLNETITDNITKTIPGMEHFAKGIKVAKDKDGVNVDVDIYLNVNFGTKIPDLAWEVQQAVKEAVEAIVTEFAVRQVNIHVQGVTLPQNKAEEG